VIQLRHRQPSLWHSGLAKDIEDLWEPWMKEVDQLLEDAALVESVYDVQGKRHRKSRTHGRTQTPAEVALRLLILKHVRNWSYDTLEREVRANLVYRAYTRMRKYRMPRRWRGWDKSSGPNGSTQHWLEVYFQATKLRIRSRSQLT
jgi:IS5 family transposase